MRNIFKYIGGLGAINAFFIVCTLMNVMNYGFLFGYIAILLMILKKNFLKTAIERNFLLLFLFSTVYALFYAMNPWKGMQYVVLYMFTPPVFYLWGKFMATVNRRTNTLFFVLIGLTVLYSLPAMISVTLNIAEGGFAQAERNIAMFWSTEIMTATGMGAFFIFNMCLPAILLASYKIMPKPVLFLLLAIFIISLLCVLRLGSRTQLGIMLISLVISLITMVPKMSLKENMAIFFTVFLAIFFVIREISFDLDSDLFTSFAGRMEEDGAADLASGGGRTQLWGKSIDNLFEKPLGWDLDEFGYSHNLWLDALRVGGIISFFLLIIYFVRNLILFRKVILNKKFAVSFQILCLTYVIGFFSLFMVEPGLDGAFPLFILYCLFVGFIRQHYHDVEAMSYENEG